MMSLLLLLSSVPILSAYAGPQPEEIRTFGDWTVGCDNEGFCRAVGLASEDDQPPLPVTIWREPGAGAGAMVEWDLTEFPEARLAVDDEWLPFAKPDHAGLVRFEGEQARDVIRKMIGGSGVVARVADGPPSGSFRHRFYGVASLAGVTAALLYMDEKQLRVGTKSALVSLGGHPGKRAMGDALPGRYVHLSRPRASTMAPTLPSAADIDRIYANLGCLEEENAEALPPQSVRLDRDHTLTIVHWPCENGAYNIHADAIIVDGRGQASPARIETINDAGEGELVGAAWDNQRRMLTSFDLGSSAGGCGLKRAFIWNGEMFRLAEQEENGHCMRTSTFIRTWTVRLADR